VVLNLAVWFGMQVLFSLKDGVNWFGVAVVLAWLRSSRSSGSGWGSYPSFSFQAGLAWFGASSSESCKEREPVPNLQAKKTQMEPALL